MTININKDEIQRICQCINLNQLKKIESLVLFVGHAHSGHSIIGSILDSHVGVALANEVNITKLINKYRLTSQQIESILLYYSMKNSEKEAWHNSEYQYANTDSLQGKTIQPVVLGDKKAGGTTRILFNNKWILDFLLEKYENRLKFIFVSRNPADVVAAYSYYMKQDPCQFHIDRYFENLETVDWIQQKVGPTQFIKVCQKEFVQNPVSETSKLLKFLEMEINLSKIKIWVKHVRSDIPGKSSKIILTNELLNQLP